jgi:signal transduction histidine kinase
MPGECYGRNMTAIRSVGEVALQDQKSPAEYRDVIGSMLEEVDRLTRLAESLLALSRARMVMYEAVPTP